MAIAAAHTADCTEAALAATPPREIVSHSAIVTLPDEDKSQVLEDFIERWIHGRNEPVQ